MRTFLSVTLFLMTAIAASAAAPESDRYPRPLAAAATTVSQAFTDRIPQIIPGVQVGPVRLGMSAYDAAGAALAFERATGCQIDLLIAAGHVAAAGTRFGGCLELSLPKGTAPIVTSQGSIPLPLPLGAWMDGPASAFVAIFGDPFEVPLMANRVALVWPSGLVAHVGGIRDGDGNVTYLAVVTPGTTVVPPIGYLRISLSSGFKEF